MLGIQLYLRMNLWDSGNVLYVSDPTNKRKNWTDIKEINIDIILLIDILFNKNSNKYLSVIP